MSLASVRSSVARVQKDLADLRTKDATEAKKEADLVGKVNKANSDARSTKNITTMTSRLRDAERYSNELASVQKKHADLSKSVASKTADLNRHMNDQTREEERERKRLADEDRKSHDARTRRLKELDRQITASRAAADLLPAYTEDDAQYDVFISHASEDKESFVNELAAKLAVESVKVWYDDMALGWGDSLRRSIDKGLARSRFGVVILSEHFFRKEWPQRELDGLVQLETAGQSRILPIWHKISRDEVTEASPMLADKIALNTSLMSTDAIVAELKKLAGK